MKKKKTKTKDTNSVQHGVWSCGVNLENVAQNKKGDAVPFKTLKLLMANIPAIWLDIFEDAACRRVEFLVPALQTGMHRKYQNSTKHNWEAAADPIQSQFRLLACMCYDNLTAAKYWTHYNITENSVETEYC